MLGSISEAIGNSISFVWTAFFYNPVLNILFFLYEVSGQNLGIAIILLTIFIKVLSIPLTQSQFDSMQKLQKIKPKLDKLQKKYKEDPITLFKKQQELYKEVGYNPVGCFSTLLLQIPIIFALFRVVKNASVGSISGIYPFLSSWFGANDRFVFNSHFLFIDVSKSLSEVAGKHNLFSAEVLPYAILSMIVVFAQFGATRALQKAKEKDSSNSKRKNNRRKRGKKDNSDEADMQEMMEAMNKSMSFYIPIMIGFSSVSLPSALSVYWIVQSIFQVFQKKGIPWLKSCFKSNPFTQINKFLNKKNVEKRKKN